jgi:hypothetical protein
MQSGRHVNTSAPISFAAFVLEFRPHVTIREPLNRFSLNLILESVSKVFRIIAVLVQMGQK